MVRQFSQRIDSIAKAAVTSATHDSIAVNEDRDSSTNMDSSGSYLLTLSFNMNKKESVQKSSETTFHKKQMKTLLRKQTEEQSLG